MDAARLEGADELSLQASMSEPLNMSFSESKYLVMGWLLRRRGTKGGVSRWMLAQSRP